MTDPLAQKIGLYGFHRATANVAKRTSLPLSNVHAELLGRHIHLATRLDRHGSIRTHSLPISAGTNLYTEGRRWLGGYRLSVLISARQPRPSAVVFVLNTGNEFVWTRSTTSNTVLDILLQRVAFSAVDRHLLHSELSHDCCSDWHLLESSHAANTGHGIDQTGKTATANARVDDLQCDLLCCFGRAVRRLSHHLSSIRNLAEPRSGECGVDTPESELLRQLLHSLSDLAAIS